MTTAAAALLHSPSSSVLSTTFRSNSLALIVNGCARPEAGADGSSGLSRALSIGCASHAWMRLRCA
jgi:hypothetical protein